MAGYEPQDDTVDILASNSNGIAMTLAFGNCPGDFVGHQVARISFTGFILMVSECVGVCVGVHVGVCWDLWVPGCRMCVSALLSPHSYHPTLLSLYLPLSPHSHHPAPLIPPSPPSLSRHITFPINWN